MNKYKIIKKVIAKVNQEKDLKSIIWSLDREGLAIYENKLFDPKHDHYYTDEENKEIFKKNKKLWDQFESSGNDLIKILEKVLSEKNFDLLNSDKHLKKVMSIFKEKIDRTRYETPAIKAIYYWMEK